MTELGQGNRCANCGCLLKVTFPFDKDLPEDYDLLSEEDCAELYEKPQEPDARSFCSRWCALEFHTEGRIFADEGEDEGDDDEESEGFDV